MKYIIDNINNYSNDEYKDFYQNIKKYKKIKIKKLISINKQKQAILGENLLIKGLKKIYNLDYAQIKILRNKNGKQYIKNKKIYYNISHSNDYVICVFANNKIGVDIEKIKNTNFKNLHQFATENEINYLLKNNDNIDKNIFQLYTLKEAYFKMKGSNLNNIKDVEFLLMHNQFKCSDNQVLIKIIPKITDYTISICQKKSSYLSR